MSNLPQANKNLGQHFLKDKKVIQTITQAFPPGADCILEVGPGPAILTPLLAEQAQLNSVNLHIIEKDIRMREYLFEIVDEDKQHFEDALSFDYKSFIDSIGAKNIWLVSNLPYNVGVPLMVEFLKHPRIQHLSLMLQKEVGQKVIPPSDKKNPSGSLMALFQTYFDVKTLCLVSPGAFLPPPKVDSIVIELHRKTDPSIAFEDCEKFEIFLRKLFAFKRKQVQKVLKPYFDKLKLEKAFAELDITPNQRAETFNLEQIQLLYQKLKR